ncbi:DUF397 domain-containing protein [Actinomadura sp. CNU-125]|uniref:DUF397 domain-containing protein n=1 Tax=Actinomadura sp. CNU-125 TaxID=1904961 RepID=UPI00096AC235|nr:DUF397 domain-containing protein [Actinomadura sp. CNU-125]
MTRWRKSSRSAEGTSGQCVEVAALPSGGGVRDSRAPEGGHLVLAPAAFRVLLDELKR